MDPVQVALEVTQLRGEQASLTQQLNTAISTMGGSLQALQGDFRELRDGQTQIVSKLHQLSDHSSGLERLGKAIEDFVADSLRWRKDHERDDKSIADRVNLWRGIFIGFGLLATLLVTFGAFYINNEFNRAAEERAAIKSDLKDVQRKLGIVP